MNFTRKVGNFQLLSIVRNQIMFIKTLNYKLVTHPNCRHSDSSPPKCFRNRRKLGSGLIFLSKICQGGKYENTHCKKQH